MNKVIKSEAYELFLMRLRGREALCRSLRSSQRAVCIGWGWGGREWLQRSNDFEPPSTLRQQQNHHGDVDAQGPN